MTDPFTPPSLSVTARRLGLLGLLPQAGAVVAAFSGTESYWVAIALGCAYAAIIFSFLGGVWWGLALRGEHSPDWIYPVAVLPSLIGLGSFLPWTFGLAWPIPSLVGLAGIIALSPLIDLAIARRIPVPSGWITLRWQLSVGLGGLTLLLALIG